MAAVRGIRRGEQPRLRGAGIRGRDGGGLRVSPTCRRGDHRQCYALYCSCGCPTHVSWKKGG